MRRNLRNVALAVIAVGAFAACDSATGPDAPEATRDPAPPELNIRLETGEDSPGPPYYSLIQPGWFPMTDDWAAVFWLRDPSCVPDAFNLLDLADLAPAFPNGPPRAPEWTRGRKFLIRSQFAGSARSVAIASSRPAEYSPEARSQRSTNSR